MSNIMGNIIGNIIGNIMGIMSNLRKFEDISAQKIIH